jgi:hypothetical protein
MESNELWSWDLLTLPLMMRYVLNLVAMLILVRFIYFRTYRKSTFISSFFLFNTIIFFVAFMLNKVEMTTGAAFGLFAVFSILRYRTDGISTKDMTYLFLSIAIGLLTSVSKGSLVDIVAIDFMILVLTYLLENNFIVQRELSKVIQYDNINFIKPEQHSELMAKLIERTGLDIKRIVINDIDFIKESCAITVYYIEKN